MHKQIIGSCIAAAMLAGCATVFTPSGGVADIAILGINDFHGHIQSADPTPRMIDIADPADPQKIIAVPTGGAAFLATELAMLRKQNPHSITVGVGDLIGASPLSSSLLDDEPALEVLNRLGLSLSSVGNHEFDAGSASLLRRIKGECPTAGCKLPGFSGAHFDYLAANVVDKDSGKLMLKPYVIREIDGIKVAFVGAPLHELPTMVMASGIKTLRFDDEAQSINRLLPEIRAQGAGVVVALVHQGGEFGGNFNDPSYRCDGLKGPIVDIVKQLDKQVDVVMSAHTHNAYTCKIDGRLVTQGYSYGALVSEIRLKVDRQTGHLITANAVNHLVDQRSLKPDAQMQQYIDQLTRMTDDIRKQVVGETTEPITRRTLPGNGDSPLGNLVADAHLEYARRNGPVDLAFTNSGGLRADLPSKAGAARPITLQFGDLYAAQPFRNSVVVMTLSGAQILAILRSQWQGLAADSPYLLQVSRSLSYQWDATRPIETRLIDVRINGAPLEAARQYRVAMNNFLAGGGDKASGFTQGTDVVELGLDVDALRWYVENNRQALQYRSEGRIRRVDAGASK